MEVEVRETYYSLVGAQPFLDEMNHDVLIPIIYHLYGARSGINGVIRDWNGNPPTPLKFILLTGRRGVGKTALTSAMVNMLRKREEDLDPLIPSKNDKIKYIRWNLYRDDEGMVQKFRQIVTEAKEKEDGRDFTILHVPYMDMAFPSSQRPVISDELQNLKTAFLEEMGPLNGSSCVGKLLIIGETTFPGRMNREILGLVEQRHFTPAPGIDVKTQIGRQIAQRQGVEISDEDLNTLASSNFITSPGEIKWAFNVALERARARQGFVPGLLNVDINDFPIGHNGRRAPRRRGFEQKAVLAVEFQPTPPEGEEGSHPLRFKLIRIGNPEAEREEENEGIDEQEQQLRRLWEDHIFTVANNYFKNNTPLVAGLLGLAPMPEVQEVGVEENLENGEAADPLEVEERERDLTWIRGEPIVDKIIDNLLQTHKERLIWLVSQIRGEAEGSGENPVNADDINRELESVVGILIRQGFIPFLGPGQNVNPQEGRQEVDLENQEDSEDEDEDEDEDE